MRKGWSLRVPALLVLGSDGPFGRVMCGIGYLVAATDARVWIAVLIVCPAAHDVAATTYAIPRLTATRAPRHMRILFY